MSTRTLISVDLDWLNGQSDPIDKLKKLLRYIPKNTPSVMTVEHHEFLPQLHRWIKSGKIPTPFNILNIDEHHDYYFVFNSSPVFVKNREINCGNWGYHVPTNWYNRLTWVCNSHGEFCDWDDAQKWLDNRNISCSVRNKHRLSELRTEIVATIFCVSPDYLHENMHDHIVEAVEMIVRHFKMKRAPKRVYNGQDIASVNGWRIAPRPMKMR